MKNVMKKKWKIQTLIESGQLTQSECEEKVKIYKKQLNACMVDLENWHLALDDAGFFDEYDEQNEYWKWGGWKI